MKVVCFSDNHGEYGITLPEGDVLIFCGDFTAHNSVIEVSHFLDYLKRQPHKVKIVVAGNHDWVCSEKETIKKRFANAGVTYLYNDLFEYEGVQFYGTPDQPRFYNWAFNRTTEELRTIYASIPEEIDVLITHCPPYGILDKSTIEKRHCGSLELLEKLRTIQVSYHIFGHIHAGYGKEEVKDPQTNELIRTYINCSAMNDFYEWKNEPQVFTITKKKKEVV